MSRRFYFTVFDTSENIYTYLGNIRGARTCAQHIANSLGEMITINDFFTGDLVDFVRPTFTEDDYYSPEGFSVPLDEELSEHCTDEFIESKLKKGV